MASNDTAAKILEAAQALFAEKGFHSVGTRLIAKTAKVNEVTVFRHFESKEKLFEKVIEHYLFRPHFEQLETSHFDNLHAVLSTFANFMHQFFAKNLNLILMELRSPSGLTDRPSLNRFPNQVKLNLAGQFVRYKGMTAEAAEIEAVCFMTSLHGLCFNFYVFKTITEGVALEDCLKTLIERHS